MEVINLATQEKQDGIKGDTEYIKGQFPISGGTDFMSGVGMVSKGSISDRDSWPKTVLEITGNGLITSFSKSFSVKVVIDGDTSNPLDSSPGFSLIPFKSSIKCTSMSAPNNGDTHNATFAYILL